jgi:hypothetical protein
MWVVQAGDAGGPYLTRRYERAMAFPMRALLARNIVASRTVEVDESGSFRRLSPFGMKVIGLLLGDAVDRLRRLLGCVPSGDRKFGSPRGGSRANGERRTGS